MSRIASAPSARDSATWYSSTMNSLRRAGSEHAARAATRYSASPWKNGLSVSTDRHAAPARSYDAAIAGGSNDSRSTPLLGLAFLISAITAGRDSRDTAPQRALEAARRRCRPRLRIDARERPRDLRRDDLLDLAATICSRMSLLRHGHAAGASFCVVATNASSLRFAAPLAMAARARSMPSWMDRATLAA